MSGTRHRMLALHVVMLQLDLCTIHSLRLLVILVCVCSLPVPCTIDLLGLRHEAVFVSVYGRALLGLRGLSLLSQRTRRLHSIDRSLEVRHCSVLRMSAVRSGNHRIVLIPRREHEMR